MAKEYVVRLSEEERYALEDLVRKGKEAAPKRLHAQILLKADEGEFGCGWKDEEIARALDVGQSTVGRVRERLVMQGLMAALNRSLVVRSKMRKLDGGTGGAFDSADLQ